MAAERTGSAIKGRIWKFGAFELAEVGRTLRKDGELVEIGGKPLDLLICLLEANTANVTKPELKKQVWLADNIEDSVIKVTVSTLRRILGDQDQALILTLYNVGYRMGVPVSCLEVDEVVIPQYRLSEGAPVPDKPSWHLKYALDRTAPHWVWAAKQDTNSLVRVFKFAEDGVRYGALKREITLSRLLAKAAPKATCFVNIFDWRLETSPYYVEAEFGGINLLEWAAKLRDSESGGLPRQLCLLVMAELCDAVDIAHEIGVFHNDLKPSNILLSQAGTDGTWHVKVSDFGIATLLEPQRLADLDITNHGFGDDPTATAVGTAMYHAPEVKPGQPSTRSADIYSLGVILYQLLSGDFAKTPTPGWQNDIDDLILQKDIEEAVNLNPALRVKSAAELAERLRTVDARRIEQELQQRQRRENELKLKRYEDSRARQPFIWGAVACLLAGLCTSLWFYKRAADDRDLANSRNLTLSAMDYFLRDDILKASNPLLGQSKSGAVQQITLLDAINAAIPQIDRRFRNAPEISGLLHREIAGSLDASTEYAAAEKEFATAADHFRIAEGPLSQNAIIAELRRENVQMRMHTPGAIEKANAGLAEQQALIARLPKITPELRAWYAFGQAGSAMLGQHPESALPLLNQAIGEAEKTPGFDPQFLQIGLKLRLGLVYIRLADWPNAERIFREVIASVVALEGPDSRSLFQPEMGLDEALYYENKMDEAKERTGHDYQQFLRYLGPNNQLTLNALYMHAEVENSVGDNENAVRDLLALYTAERSNPSGKTLQENSLSSAALIECHMGRFDSGIEHARQAMKESSAEPSPEPVFVNTSRFTIAECLIAQQEASAKKPNPKVLDAADALLKNVDLAVVTQTSGLSDYEEPMDVAAARLALLRGDRETARSCAGKAAPFAQKPGSDPYEKQALAKVVRSLGH